MIDLFNKCPYCEKIFYNGKITESEEQFEKYKHLSKHKEFKDKINLTLKDFPNINKWVPIKLTSKFNVNRNTHQLIQILYNREEIEYKHLLKNFDCYLKDYANYLENKEKNLIKNKTLSDFFAFYSELEVMDKIYKIFDELPLIIKSDKNLNIDFVLNKSKLLIEVKTPLESKKRLFDYIVEWKSQKQIKYFKEKNNYGNHHAVLILNSRYSYFEFGALRGFNTFKTNRKIYWDCCIVYNNFHHRGDIYFNTNISNNKNYLIALFNKLRDNY